MPRIRIPQSRLSPRQVSSPPSPLPGEPLEMSVFSPEALIAERGFNLLSQVVMERAKRKREQQQLKSIASLLGLGASELSGLPPELAPDIGLKTRALREQQAKEIERKQVLNEMQKKVSSGEMTQKTVVGSSEVRQEFQPIVTGEMLQKQGYSFDQSKAILSGNREELLKAFPDYVPEKAMRLFLTSQGQGNIQGRFDRKEKTTLTLAGAKEQLKSDKVIATIKEGRGFLADLAARKIKLEDTIYAGSPQEAFLGKAVSTVTGGRLGTAEIKAFEDVKKGLIARLKRLTGDIGILTEVDAERLERLMPSLGESNAVTKTKLDMINKMLDLAENGEAAALDNYLQNIGIKELGTAGFPIKKENQKKQEPINTNNPFKDISDDDLDKRINALKGQIGKGGR